LFPCITWYGLPRVSPERHAQPSMLLQVESLRTHRRLNSQLGQLAVHLGLVPSSPRRAGQRPTQVLAAMDVQVTEEMAEAAYIADVGPLDRVGANLNDGRRHLRPRPEHGGR